MTKLLPYQKYKDSGVHWVGEVPQLWDVARLRYLARIETGSRDTVDSEVNGPYPFFVRSQTVEAIDTFSYECEAVLTAGDGAGVGKVFHHFTGKFEAHQRVYVMHAFKHISGRFFFYYFQNLFSKVALDGGAKSTVDSLRRPMLADFPVTVPTAPEQKAIVAFLDRETAQIDDLIAKQERLIELLAEKRQATINHAVTKGLDPSAPTKPSGVPWLGDIPAHWSAVRFSRILRGIKDGTHGTHLRVDVGMPLLGSTNVRSGYLERYDDESQISAQEHLSIVANGYPRSGDILLAIIGASIGRSCVYELSYPLAFQRSVAFLRPTTTNDPKFIQLFMESDFYQKLLWNNVNSSAQGGVYLGVLGSLTAVVPPLDEQQMIVKTLTKKIGKIDVLVSKAEGSIKLLQERRSALISAAVTGKIDVRERVDQP